MPPSLMVSGCLQRRASAVCSQDDVAMWFRGREPAPRLWRPWAANGLFGHPALSFLLQAGTKSKESKDLLLCLG
jgi:hypothetical protein